jgi:hypothetical protein
MRDFGPVTLAKMRIAAASDRRDNLVIIWSFLLPPLGGRGTASRSVEIGDLTYRSLCGNRRRVDLCAPWGGSHRPRAEKDSFRTKNPDGNQVFMPGVPIGIAILRGPGSFQRNLTLLYPSEAIRNRSTASASAKSISVLLV